VLKYTISLLDLIFEKMQYYIHSYRFAQEIVEHPEHRHHLDGILSIVRDCPLYIFPGKSKKNKRLDVVQQLLNTYFDKRFVNELGWEYHPDATRIPNSDLAADFRTQTEGLRIQTEVQFGNMARWYSDIFKFQTAYSQDLIDMGLCIVPIQTLATRIDSNVAYYERCIRELPSAKLSITLPILVIGIEADRSTPEYDVSQSPIGRAKGNFIGQKKTENRNRIVHGISIGTPLSELTESSPTGRMGPAEVDLDDQDEDD
jgi:hypothetical protein